jgi:hypothetical protein
MGSIVEISRKNMPCHNPGKELGSSDSGDRSTVRIRTAFEAIRHSAAGIVATNVRSSNILRQAGFLVIEQPIAGKDVPLLATCI